MVLITAVVQAPPQWHGSIRYLLLLSLPPQARAETYSSVSCLNLVFQFNTSADAGPLTLERLMVITAIKLESAGAATTTLTASASVAS
jgi:hypothetical protein